MKHLRLIFICSLLLAAMQIQAQTPTIKWGPVHKMYCFYPVVYDGYYYGRNHSHGTLHVLEKVDTATANVVLRKDYDAVSGITNATHEIEGNLIPTAGGLLLLQWIGNRDKFSGSFTDPRYVIRLIDTSTLEVSQPLCMRKALGIYNLSFRLSPDKKLLCLYVVEHTSTNESKVNFMCFNTISQKLEWDLELNYHEENNSRYSVNNVFIYNDGTVTGLLWLKVMYDNWSVSKKNHSLQLFKIKSGAITYSEPKETVWTIEEIKPLKGDKFLAVGVYYPSKINYDTRELGCFTAELNPLNGELLNVKVYPNSQQKTDYENSMEVKDVRDGELHVDGVVPLENGEVVLIFAKSVFSESRYKLVLGIKPDGSIKYEKIIPFIGSWNNPYHAIARIKDDNVALIQRSGGLKYICIQPDGEYKIVEIKDEASNSIAIPSIHHVADNKFVLYHMAGYKGGAYGILDLNN